MTIIDIVFHLFCNLIGIFLNVMFFFNFLREAAYECIGKSGKASFFDQFVQLYLDTESSQEKLRILRKGFASFSNKVIGLIVIVLTLMFSCIGMIYNYRMCRNV